MSEKNIRSTLFKLFVLIAIAVFGLRFVRYGSLFRSCIYTENEIPLATSIAHSKLFVFRSAAILTGADPEYECLPEIGAIQNELLQVEDAKYYPSRVSKILSANSGLRLSAVKLISVTKHGFSTIDSGPEPIGYLVMRDENGLLY